MYFCFFCLWFEDLDLGYWCVYCYEFFGGGWMDVDGGIELCFGGIVLQGYCKILDDFIGIVVDYVYVEYFVSLCIDYKFYEGVFGIV